MAPCDEFAYGCTGDLNAYGPLVNPIAPDRLVGGSSSGCAVAVASGAADGAIGTDTAGSVRIPAALCGTIGFKPSYGSVSRDGVFPLSESLDHVGVLGRSLELVSRLASGLLGPSLDSPPFRGTELTIVRVLGHEADVMDDEVQVVWARIVAALNLAPEGRLPGWDEAQTMGAVVQAQEAWRAHRATVNAHPDLIHPDVLGRLRSAASVSAGEYRTARRAMERCRAGAAEALGEADVVALPTVPVVPPRRGRSGVELGRKKVSVRGVLLRNTRFANYSGLPALSLPVWVNDARYPIGLQLVGRTDAEVLAAGEHAVAQLEASGLRTSPNPTNAPQGRPAVAATPLDS